jgi:hypothetical protein
MFVAHFRRSFAAAFFPRLSEWAGAVGIFAVGLVLSANADLMANAKTSSYNLMLWVGPQIAWSVGMMVFGFMRLLILLVNGAWRRSPHLRAATAFLSMLPFTLITLSFYQTFGIAMALVGVFVAMELINTMRAASDARTVDDNMRGKNGSRAE